MWFLDLVLLLFGILILAFLGTQVIYPMLNGTKKFPLFLREAKLTDQIVDLNQKVVEKELEKKINDGTLKDFKLKWHSSTFSQKKEKKKKETNPENIRTILKFVSKHQKKDQRQNIAILKNKISKPFQPNIGKPFSWSNSAV